jgi:hypothetical protein
MLISYESASPCYIPKRSRMGALHVTLVHYIMPLHGTNEHLQSLIHGDQIYLVIYSVSSNEGACKLDFQVILRKIMRSYFSILTEAKPK